MKSQDVKASKCSLAARNAGRPGFKRLGLPLAIWLALPGLARGEDSAPSVLQSIPVLAKPAAAAAPAQPVETVTEELIRLLADRFALSQEDANRLIKRLRDEHAQAAAKADTSPAALAAAQPPAAEPKGRVRIVYLPETEKKRIREEVREEVIAQAKAENWAQPYTLPSWVKNVQIDGDVRLRGEFDYLDPSNSPQFINFQSINSGLPLNTNPPVGQPLSFPVINSTEDRQQPRVRARLGILANVSDNLSGAVRVTTGNTSNPVSPNQTLGNDFNKFSIVIDRAYFNYRPRKDLSLWGGRIPSPWLSTELVWDEDLGFDGLAGQYRHAWTDTLSQVATAGVFSVENTDFNYPATSLQKGNSRDKWLLGVQTGAEWQLSDRTLLKGAVAFYDYVDIEGELSNPCYAPSTNVSCDSDASRPLFVQKGNTLFALRDLVVLTPSDPTYQYFGLASEFSLLDINVRLDRAFRDGKHLVVDLDGVYNFGYDAGKIRKRIPVNNFGPCPADAPGCSPPFDGGNHGFLVNVLWGVPKIVDRGQWNVFFGYRRLESDAVLDAFTDSDFHLGGTNAKGFHLGGGWGIAHNAWLNARWLSATEVTGAPYSGDVLQLDLNSRF